jgi:predicted component of type VI protein secretion system
VELRIERGQARRCLRTLDQPLYLIGRAKDCDLVLGDDQFADYHAYIRLHNDEIWFRHLGEAPEVTVNGRAMRWGELQDGDRLRTGPYQFKIYVRGGGVELGRGQPVRPAAWHHSASSAGCRPADTIQWHEVSGWAPHDRPGARLDTPWTGLVDTANRIAQWYSDF